MAKLAPHELLGVEPGSSTAEIKVAYLRLVKAYHPDRSDPFMARHNQEMTKLINAAYEKLKDRS
jgi:curved DNA-binding protein CbpA